MDLFTVAAKLKLDSGEFEKNLRKMDREGKSFADSLKNTFSKVKNLAVAVGSAFAVKKIADGLWSVANAAAQAGDKIDKQSQALGMSRKAYQEWEYILSQSGASIDSMGVSMKTLNSAILEGSDDTRQALSKLHLSTTELKHMSQEDAFKKVVEAFQKIPAGAQKSALAVQLFGRNGQELLPLLNSSAESIDELRRQANELGLVMSDEDVNASVAFGDALDTLKRTFTSFKYRFGAQILPALTNGMGKITDYAGKLRKAYDAKGFAGVFDTVVSDVKNIKWPSWSDVRAAAEAGWETIKKGVADFGGLVFGKNEKGEVNWPTIEELQDAAKNLWGNLKTFVSNVFNLGGKLIFGTDKTNGEVKWPSIDDLKQGAKDLWGQLKTFVANAFNLGGKLIFGENTDGEVNYPTWEKIGETIRGAWDTIVLEAGRLTGFVLGNIGDASTAIAGIEEKWNNLKTTVTANAIDFISGLTGTDSGTAADILGTLATSLEAIGTAIATYSLVSSLPAVINTITGLFTSGISAVNPVAIALAAIAAAGVLIYKNWDGIQEFFENLWAGVSTAVSDAWDKVKVWWGDNILGPIQEKWNEVSGYFTEFWSGIIGPIQTAIDKVKEFFGLSQSTGQGLLDNGQVQDLFSEYRKVKRIERDRGSDAAQTDFERFKNNFAQELREAGASAEEIEQVLNNIDMSMSVEQMGEYITSLSAANTEANSLKDTLDSVAGNYEVNINIHTNGTIPSIPFGGGPIPNPKYMKHAIGAANIPYDNYPAMLHRNEMVLNATQARQYREGKGNGAGIDLDAMVNRIVAAVTTGIENANIDLDGEKITRNVNRRLAASVRAKRFA